LEKKKQFPKQNIWNIPRISNGDSSEDEEDYSSNDYSNKNSIEFKIYTLLYIYEHYNTWLSENKQLFEPSIKHFIIKNDTFELESI
jgi:hypothetical protein